MTPGKRPDLPDGNGDRSSAPVPTSFEELDAQLGGGFQPGAVTLAVAPSPLLQSFGLACARAAVTRKPRPASTCFFSLGAASAPTLARRVLAGEAGVDLQRIRTGRMSESGWQRLASAGGKLSQAPLFVNDSLDPSAAEMAVEMDKVTRSLRDGGETTARGGLDFVVVGPLPYLGDHRETLTPEEASRGGGMGPKAVQTLKHLAEQRSVAVLALAPATPETPDSRPRSETDRLSDLFVETTEQARERATAPVSGLSGLRLAAGEHLGQAHAALLLQFQERGRLVAAESSDLVVAGSESSPALAVRDLVEALVVRSSADGFGGEGSFEGEGPPVSLTFAGEYGCFGEGAACDL